MGTSVKGPQVKGLIDFAGLRSHIKYFLNLWPQSLRQPQSMKKMKSLRSWILGSIFIYFLAYTYIVINYLFRPSCQRLRLRWLRLLSFEGYYDTTSFLAVTLNLTRSSGQRGNLSAGGDLWLLRVRCPGRNKCWALFFFKSWDSRYILLSFKMIKCLCFTK